MRILGVPPKPCLRAVGRFGRHPQNQHWRSPPILLPHQPAHKHSEIAVRRAPSPPRNNHDHESLTNWRNTFTWYPSRAMAVETETPAYMQPPRRVRRPRRGFTQNALIAWLDEQERLIRMRGLPNEVVEEFDPLHNLPQPQDEQGRRTLLFRFDTNLASSIADQIQRRVVASVKSCFMLKLSAFVELRNIADARKMAFYQVIGTSRWFETLAASQTWVSQQEELRLENQRRPNTQWTYEKTQMVFVKVILDRHPLFLGLGRLPDLIRNKRGAELLGPGHHLRQVGQDLRRHAYQVLAPVRVV